LVEYFVQAVDASGNVGMTSFKGAFHEGVVVPTSAPGTDPTVGITGTLFNDWFTTGATVTVSGGDYTATVDGIAQDLSSGSFTIGADGVHIVRIFGGEPDPVTFAVKVDTTNPEVVILSPAHGGTYLLGQAVPADYRCADAGSGVQSCIGLVPDGVPFDTAAVGSKSFSVTATDFAGHSSSASAIYHVVRDLDLAVSPALLAVGDTATATSPVYGTFLSAVIDWGDGTTCRVGAAAECTVTGSPEGILTATHAYGAPGVYAVTLTVVYAGLTLTDTFEFVVVYDPSAGFVTGGGSIESPAGAYSLNPSLTGKASFGFVARYKKGQTTPDGNTQFQFKAADFKFMSVAYEWLVVAGSRAQFKGTGTVNGSKAPTGEYYKFFLVGIDGDLQGSDKPDAFRIRVWYELDGEEVVVYDNQRDEYANSDAATELGGGSIVIHSSKK
ncbi:MAG TPA: hypothetical protein DCY40_06615, partial [Actinobacteria bacterium]|nr:hypothetical protein [Actinomycetota bacterium]